MIQLLMDNTYWHKLQSIFDEALLVGSDQRNAFLAEACAGDSELHEDIINLLEAHTNVSKNWGLSPVSTSTSQPIGLMAPYQEGDEIGHHKIIAQIGIGGMGVIYQAFDSHLERNVALKFLPAFLHSDELSRLRFMSEARSASRLDHPNICVIHDIDETPEGHMYITMPHYLGETLAARLKRGPLQYEDALAITIQIANGLASAHAHDIIHRDIKPANIMLTEHNVVKILDFGIAKVTNIHLTGAGVSLGTLAYMAPEQMRGEEVDARADVWALGITLYEMLTGKTTLKGNGMNQETNPVLNKDTAPVKSLPDQVPELMHRILITAMQRNRDDRYPNISAMLEDCMQIQETLTTEKNPNPHRRHINKKVYEWDPRFLDTVVNILMPELGPITSKLVYRQAQQAENIEALCSALCEHLPNEETRQKFSEKLKLKAAMDPTPPAPA